MEIHGLLLVDKPSDMTSHDVVAVLRRRLRQKRIGHTGTLDPIATGLMVVVLGEATKLSDYLVAEDKAYSVDIRLGLETDTLDRTGQVLRTMEPDVTEDQVRDAVQEQEGTFDWPVPMFSAVKVDGQPLHKAAREGREMETPVKQMAFWNLRWKALSQSQLSVDMECSKGSFVRTWVQKLGERLGTGAIVDELRRTRVGAWRVDQALPLATIEQSSDLKDLGRSLVSIGESLPGFRSVIVDERDARLMLNGQIPKDVAARLIPEQKTAFASQEPVYIKIISGSGDLLAMLAAQPGQGLKIRRVFRFS